MIESIKHFVEEIENEVVHFTQLDDILKHSIVLSSINQKATYTDTEKRRERAMRNIVENSSNESSFCCVSSKQIENENFTNPIHKTEVLATKDEEEDILSTILDCTNSISTLTIAPKHEKSESNKSIHESNFQEQQYKVLSQCQQDAESGLSLFQSSTPQEAFVSSFLSSTYKSFPFSTVLPDYSSYFSESNIESSSSKFSVPPQIETSLNSSEQQQISFIKENDPFSHLASLLHPTPIVLSSSEENTQATVDALKSGKQSCDTCEPKSDSSLSKTTSSISKSSLLFERLKIEAVVFVLIALQQQESWNLKKQSSSSSASASSSEDFLLKLASLRDLVVRFCCIRGIVMAHELIKENENASSSSSSPSCSSSEASPAASNDLFNPQKHPDLFQKVSQWMDLLYLRYVPRSVLPRPFSAIDFNQLRKIDEQKRQWFQAKVEEGDEFAVLSDKRIPEWAKMKFQKMAEKKREMDELKKERDERELHKHNASTQKAKSSNSKHKNASDKSKNSMKESQSKMMKVFNSIKSTLSFSQQPKTVQHSYLNMISSSNAFLDAKGSPSHPSADSISQNSEALALTHSSSSDLSSSSVTSSSSPSIPPFHFLNQSLPPNAFLFQPPFDSPIVELSNIPLTKRKMQCLIEGEWLNDEVINFTIELMKRRMVRTIHAHGSAEEKQRLKISGVDVEMREEKNGAEIEKRKAMGEPGYEEWDVEKDLLSCGSSGWNPENCCQISLSLHKEEPVALQSYDESSTKTAELPSLDSLWSSKEEFLQDPITKILKVNPFEMYRSTVYSLDTPTALSQSSPVVASSPSAAKFSQFPHFITPFWRDTSLPLCYATNTFFYGKVSEGGVGYNYDMVKRWTRRRKAFVFYEREVLINNSSFISKISLSSSSSSSSISHSNVPNKIKLLLPLFDKIVVPIHRFSHWTLCVINLRLRRFEYYDSLKGSGENVVATLRRWVKDEINDKGIKIWRLQESSAASLSGAGKGGSDVRVEEEMSREEKEAYAAEIERWPLYRPAQMPVQENGCDCGMFMLLSCDCVMRNSSLNFSQSAINYVRNSLVEVLRNSGGDGF
ncbi:putative sentrin-specific protease 1 [Monocercomonoides exilis]|uniref:putative sentrin-specific protease 1 n=1 Tax=Monocercomonoides exilis TaxID=2049356 RepID=UPI0035597359|nr:putative sentrin-specific protease 1 [Monocercomonoides exilis]|eukprot:MONOS_3469.1-p1 / transcript=MONOS_3469.1 / gene=MONOS_3469 / organism=Monocercomonoides_exilis_PA203 / gene_product=unspecified product / transcript_product=unspecified product / location=Mono_scaffold00082:47798-51007(-) / protein_length=1069 / sequence_SO=supercontig / SO=protein_coding / is_pseudo=false